jgi:uncharacterized protein
MTLLDEIRAKKPELLMIAEKYGVYDIRVFGSVARGEERPDSDVDLLVKLEKGRSYFDLGGFQVDASDLFHRKTDVMLDHTIRPIIAKEIFADVKGF